MWVLFGLSSRNIEESWEKKTHCIPWSHSFKLLMFNKVWTETNSGQVWQRICCMKKQRLSFLSPHSLKGHFCAPIWLSCHDNWSLWFKPNIINKLIKHRKKREPYQSTRKLTTCLIQALSAWNSLLQVWLVMLSV